MTTSGLTEKTEAVIKGLVDRSERERAAGLHPAFTAAIPAVPSADAPPVPPPPVADSAAGPHATRSETTIVTVSVQTLVEAPQTPDEVVDHLLGPEIREKYPIHLGFYLKPVHKEMIEQINEKLHRGRSAIVRRAIEHLYLDLKERGLLDDPAGEGNRGKRKGRGAS